MKYEFRVYEHVDNGGESVEVWQDGHMIGTIYPNVKAPGIRFVTPHLMAAEYTRATFGKDDVCEITVQPAKGV